MHTSGLVSKYVKCSVSVCKLKLPAVRVPSRYYLFRILFPCSLPLAFESGLFVLLRKSFHN
jgi:hypothetical protein